MFGKKRPYQEPNPDFAHPMHGGHPLAWPPIFNQFVSFPVRHLLTAMFYTSIVDLVSKGGVDIQFDSLIYDDRFRIWNVAWGGSEAANLSNVVNTQPIDLPWWKEAVGLCEILIQLRSGIVQVKMSYRGCVWPSDIRNPGFKPLIKESAVAAAIQQYGSYASMRKSPGLLDMWMVESKMMPLYHDWREIENGGRNETDVKNFLEKWRKEGKIIT
ncbi:MAG: hypothetical protein AAF639_21535 [Chloroflexota bacterium]